MLRIAKPCAPRTREPQLYEQLFLSCRWFLAFTKSFKSLVVRVVNKYATKNRLQLLLHKLKPKLKRRNKLMLTSVMRTWRVDVSMTVKCWRADRRHQRRVSRLRLPFPSPETIARLASLADFFFAHAELFLAKTTVSPRSLPLERVFFLLFPPMQSLVLGKCGGYLRCGPKADPFRPDRNRQQRRKMSLAPRVR